MNVYDDVLDPTVVSHSIVGHFTTSDYQELLTVRTNILTVYCVKEDGKLNWTNEFKLHGKITDLALIPQANSSLDCLLLCTSIAKISVVKFDVLSNNIETFSLHYYEDKFRDISILDLAKESKLRVDQSKRCVLLFNHDAIALLPLRASNLEDDEEETDAVNGRDNKRAKTDADKVSFPSKIFSVQELDKDIRNVVDVNFLHGFSKPTVAILYEKKLAWAGNRQLNPLPMSYTVFTLDISSHEDTTRISATVIGKVSELAWDLHTLLPVSNGCVIVGTNELAFVDNSGSLQSIILLNSFIDKINRQGRIIDASKQQILLNEPMVHHWSPPTNQRQNDETLLLMDAESNFYYIQLESEGRLLVKFDIITLPIVNDTFKRNTGCSCISRLDSKASNEDQDLFIGFKSGDALVVRLNSVKSAVETRDHHKQLSEAVENLYDQDEDEDYLYSDGGSKGVKENNAKDLMVETVNPFDIELLSSIRNIGPITSLATGKVCSVEKFVKGLSNPNRNEFSIVATSGNGGGSHITEIQGSVRPAVELALKFISITQMWNLKIKGKDKFLVTTDSNKSKSDIYRIDDNFALHKEGRFRRDATTVYMSIFGGGKRIVQVTTNNLILYDTNFRRLTTIKFDYEVVHVSVMDPYILITVSRGDIKIYELELKHKKKLLRVDLPDVLKEMVITSGVISKSNICNEFFSDLEDPEEEQLLFTFATADNQIIFFPKTHNDRVFQLNGIDKLKESLYISTYQLPDEIVPDPSIKQVMINKLGHGNKEEYLTILTFGGEVYQYKRSSSSNRFYRNTTSSDIRITGAPDNAYAKGVSDIERIMYHIPEFNGYSVILISGSVPYIIIKEDDSSPRLFRFGNIPLVSLTRWGKSSVMCVDDIKNARVYTLDCHDIYYGNNLPIRRIDVSDALEDFMTLTKVTYHEKSQMFIVSYARNIEYEALGEDGDKLVGYQEGVPHAKSFQSGILLINPRTWNIIDRKDLPANTLINDVRSMMIQLDSRTRRKKELVVAGVTVIGTEDLPPSGSFIVFDVTEVVPEPGKPDTNFKLSEVFQEEVRGTVSTICDISGRFLINQSQKVIVRDVQEDNSVVPVAFLDIPVLVTDAKSFGNFLIIGDAMQGFQFIGFDAEPYRMIPLGRSILKMETISLEFLVNGGDIFFAITDTENILHVFKYAPDEPNSLSGQRLIHCTSFNLHSTNTCMALLPKNEEFEPAGSQTRAFQALGGQMDGSLFKILPLREDAYRRLYVLQQHISEKETQLAGLNPKMERLANGHFKTTHVMRPMLDFNVIEKFKVLSIDRRKQISQKVGKRAHFDIWRDLINIEFSMRSLCG